MATEMEIFETHKPMWDEYYPKKNKTQNGLIIHGDIMGDSDLIVISVTGYGEDRQQSTKAVSKNAFQQFMRSIESQASEYQEGTLGHFIGSSKGQLTEEAVNYIHKELGVHRVVMLKIADGLQVLSYYADPENKKHLESKYAKYSVIPPKATKTIKHAGGIR